MKKFHKQILYSRGASGPSLFREKLIRHVAGTQEINCHALEDIPGIIDFLSTKEFLRGRLYSLDFKIWRRSDLFRIFGKYSMIVSNAIIDTIKRKHGIELVRERQFFHIYANKAIEYFRWLGKLDLRENDIFLEDWHYLESTLLIVANDHFWEKSNTFFGCFGNGYLKLAEVDDYKANSGPYATNFCSTGIALLENKKFAQDVNRYFDDRYARRSGSTSNNILMTEEAKLKQQGVSRVIEEQAIICVNSIADSYYHIQERLFNSENDWLQFTVETLASEGIPFRVKLHPQAKAYGEYDADIKLLRSLGVKDKLVESMGTRHLTDPYYLPITNKGTVFQERTANGLSSIVAVPRFIDVSKDLRFRVINDYYNELINQRSTLEVSEEMALIARCDLFLLENYFSMFKDIEVMEDLGVNARNVAENVGWAERHFSQLSEKKSAFDLLAKSVERLLKKEISFLFEDRLLAEYGHGEFGA